MGKLTTSTFIMMHSLSCFPIFKPSGVDEMSAASAGIKECVQDDSLSEVEKRQQLAADFNLNDLEIDEALQKYGCRILIHDQPLSLPKSVDFDLLLESSVFSHYLAYLQSQTPEGSWEERSNDLLKTLTKIGGHVYNDSMEDKYGLVIGDVQSGKTSNFIGLIASAIDQNIPLVIVLSGTTNTLRNQTQIRFDEAFEGCSETTVVCLTQADTLHEARNETEQWISGDFSHADHYDASDGAVQPTHVMVVKKNANTLERVLEWIRGSNFEEIRNRVLIIDDESDAASINTVPRADLDHSHDELHSIDERATTINRIIRQIISHLPSTYVGYTATPYAVLLQDPHEDDDELGLSLFPRDFIVTIPTPTAHCGLAEYFAPHGHLRNNVMTVDDVGEIEHRFPPSLSVSIVDYIITGGLKFNFNGKFTHHTMLVHTHMDTENHGLVAHRIRLYGVEISRRYLKKNSSGHRTNMYDVFRNRWRNQVLYQGLEDLSDEEIDGSIRAFLTEFNFRTNVNEINSNDDDEGELYERDSRLNFNSGRPVLSIAVGGQILSRGLTIEGLVISYFLRNTAMYDTLAQMARWCGYHSEYVQSLIKVRLTPQILRWLSWVYTVDVRIREDVHILENTPDAMPVDIAPRILAYRNEEDDFLPTRVGAMQTAYLFGQSLSGKTKSSLHLPLESAEDLSNNEEILRTMLQSVNTDAWHPTENIGGNFAPVQFCDVIEFIQNFKTSSSSRSLNISELVQYLESRHDHGELNQWTVAVLSPGTSRPVNLDWDETKLGPHPNTTRRGKSPSGRLEVLVDKRHMFIDIDDELIPPGATKSRLLAREIRPVTHGLLVIYILDSEYQPGDSAHDFHALFPSNDEQSDVVSFGIILPETSAPYDLQEYWMANNIGNNYRR
jgi:hypothetical protein